MFAKFIATGLLAVGVLVPRVYPMPVDAASAEPATISVTIRIPDRVDRLVPIQLERKPEPIPSTFEPTTQPPAPVVVSPAEIAVQVALDQIGKPYRWATRGPDSFDCSGLMTFAWGAAGYDFQALTYAQWNKLPHYPLADVQPGDLVFSRTLGHVYMYVGDGMVIHAPGTGKKVRLDQLPAKGIRNEVVRPTG